jgi:chitodextrinase
MATNSTDGVDFSSREATDTKRRPQLVVGFASTSSDGQAPSAPTGVTGTAPAATRVDLSWTAATDNVGVSGYRIYRDGSLLAKLGAVTSYSDTTTRDGASYRYEVQALDAAGNGSPLSATATVKTPTTLTLAPEADARVEEASRSSNYGTSSTLRTDGGSDPDVETYLRFRIPGAAGSLQSAKLRLYATSGTVNGPAVYSTGSSWSETAIAWASRPSRTSAATDDKGSISSGAWVEYDVKSLLSGDGTDGFVLATNSTDGVDFPSREASDSTRRPRLVLTYSSG